MPAASRGRSQVVEAYRTRTAGIRKAVLDRIRSLYGDVDPDSIGPSMEKFITEAEPVIAAGQASMATLVAAFIRAHSAVGDGDLVEPIDALEELAGTTRDGKPLREGMAAWGPMVLGQLAAGRTVEEALDYGRYLAERFGDNELTGAADREIERQAQSPRVVAWDGIVSPSACDPCTDNAGRHELDEAPYRHPGCQCTQVLVFA